jgi:hypothetical protein
MSAEPSRSQRDLHFDLSHLGKDLHAGKYTLHAGKGRYKLEPHTAETLRSAGLAGGAGSPPTHVARGVAVAQNQVNLVRVYGDEDKQGFPALVSVAISTPSDNGVYGTADIGKALVFVNATVSVLTPTHADTVLAHIGNADHLPGLTAAITAAGASWCTPQGVGTYEYVLDPGVLNATAPVSTQSKARIYSDTSLLGARWNLAQGRSYIDMNAPPAKARATPRRAPGTSAYNVDIQDAGPNFGLSITLNGLSDDFVLDFTITNSYVRHCAVFVSFLDGKTAITIPDNTWTQLAKAAQAALLLAWDQALDKSPHKQVFLNLITESTNTLKWCGLVSSESTFMGVPVSSTDIEFSFQIPTEDQNGNNVQVSKIRVLVGSLGVSSGNDWDPQAAWLGLVLTSFLDLALPTFALVTGVGEESSSIFESIFTDKGFLISTAASVYTVASDLFSGSANFGNDFQSALTSLADAITSKVLTSTEVVTALAGYFGAEEAAEAIPIAGWALKVAALEAVVEQLVQTVGEVVGSPRVVEFDMTITMNVQITLVPSQQSNNQFPLTASKCLLTAEYSDGTARTYTQPITDINVAQIVINWDNVPVGGTVNFTVAMLDPNGWGVGSGMSGITSNLINGADQNGNPALVVTIDVNQQLYPLAADTTYMQKFLLQYGVIPGTNGPSTYYWQQNNTPPSQTVSSLGTGSAGSILERLHGITLNADLGLIGYGWEASGLGIPPVGDDTPQTELYTMQNIGIEPLLNEPESMWLAACYMTAPAGYSKGARLVYRRSLQGANGDFGTGCFFLDPSGDRASGFHLRQVTPVTSPGVPMTDPSRQFDLATGASFGRFSVYPTSLAIHSNGYVAAVNSTYDTLQILKLPPQSVADAQAPWAFMPTGSGTGPGRLSAPTLVAIRPDQTILVLEAGNQRIQAFSCGGHPVPIASLSGRPVFWIPLVSHASNGANVVYLSMSVDVVGFAYVLSYSGNGYDASQFHLDIYTADGEHLSSQQGFVAADLAVDLWRNAYTLNFEQMSGPGGRPEPTISTYIPSTPKQS